MFKVVAFDMDGTIADTIPMCIEAFKNSVSPYTNHELSEEEIVNTFGLNEVGMVKSVVSQNWKSAINDFYYQYEYLHNNVTEVFDGILNLFELLKYKKIIVALITGKGERSCAITLEKLGISKVFDDILYGSEISPNKKQNIEYILKKYNISKDEFCYIGDTVQDIKICQEVGVYCFSAAWQKTSNVVALEKENPYYVFRNVKDLYKYFK
ncbi:phosphoglycolate phosphatase [Tyzzerella sp. An114]|uniref:HAD family hydrolase n=1 Tax=Tyzzerella sp. An114 TaxID=1965545 RepID=UPI000B42EF1E|nr:HAD hydrolase-like protein [Tyzzerella sp. An114]OUQ55668.1 phosphoglycolate phosphatase [Tyzzerella sp. An114]